MQNESQQIGSTDSIAVAKNRLRTGAVPDWVIECSYSPQFKPGEHAPVTYLLLNTQIHAERRELFVQNVIRLETMEAVQHFSQWRLQFEPKTQFITLHSLKIRRGDAEIDHLEVDKAHFLQREEGLEKFVIGGWFTFLMILSDVRPGDILEYAYTIQNQPRLLENNGSFFFSLPSAVSVGKYHFLVQFESQRGMKWKSSASTLNPTETRKDTAVFWTWDGENYTGAKPESHMPFWYLANPWIQISDFSDWKTIAGAIFEVWRTEEGDQTISNIAKEIEATETDLPARVEKAIRLIQDQYRYLSVNLEFGGQIPSAPETVIQRRFGDCKDLSWLLVNLFKKLGVQARPVLVNTSLAKTIGELLPAPSLFNHVVVEFEIDGKRRWVDTTIKQQGGGPFNRSIPDFGFGLPVDIIVEGLVKPPQISGQSNLFDLHETILLDTRGGLSSLAVIQQNEGHYADGLRQQLATIGLEEMARQRSQSATGRFRDARRIGTLQYRDDRDNNRFVLTEVFEFRPFLDDHPNDKLCRFHTPTNWITSVLAMPENTPRKTPFGLPYPCRISHVVDIESPAIQRMQISDPRAQLSNQHVEFSRTDKTGHEYLVMKLMMETKADSVPADQTAQHAKFVEQIWRAAIRELSIQKGYSAPLKKRGFGELPPVAKKDLPAFKPIAPLVEPVPDRPAPVHKRRKHHEYRRQNFPAWLKIALRLAIALGIGLMLLMAHRPHP